MPFSAKLQLGLALFFAIVAAGIWCVFLRRTPTHSATGRVTGKSFKPAGEYWQPPSGERSGFWTPTRIPIAECYVFEIQLDDRPMKVVYSVNTVAAREFDVGQRVVIEYVERGIPFVWKRIYVSTMRRAD